MPTVLWCPIWDGNIAPAGVPHMDESKWLHKPWNFGIRTLRKSIPRGLVETGRGLSFQSDVRSAQRRHPDGTEEGRGGTQRTCGPRWMVTEAARGAAQSKRPHHTARPSVMENKTAP